MANQSYWQRGFNDAVHGRRAKTEKPSRYFPGYQNGFSAGLAKRAEQLATVKDHQIAQAVNELTEIARRYHDTQQLRDRISKVVLDLWHGRTQGSTTTDTR